MPAVIDATVLEFRAMGSPCRVVVVGGPSDLAERCQDLIASLERRWSRFLAHSEVSALNLAAGSITIVSSETYRLVELACTGQELTDGWFNPLLLDQLEIHGYQQPWDPHNPPVPADEATHPAADEPILLYPDISAVCLPSGARFDPGGVGKGLAVDMAVDLCIDAGASTISVELGGDLRVHGMPWYGEHWRIGVENPFGGDEIAAFTPANGAVTTSTTMRRCWESDGRRFHHLLDPATGAPSQTDIVSVTTCSSTAWWAEIAAKAALLHGAGQATTFLTNLETPGIAVTADRRILRTESNQ